jgi:hypothetical protein
LFLNGFLVLICFFGAPAAFNALILLFIVFFFFRATAAFRAAAAAAFRAAAFLSCFFFCATFAATAAASAFFAAFANLSFVSSFRATVASLFRFCSNDAIGMSSSLSLSSLSPPSIPISSNVVLVPTTTFSTKLRRCCVGWQYFSIVCLGTCCPYSNVYVLFLVLTYQLTV